MAVANAPDCSSLVCIMREIHSDDRSKGAEGADWELRERERERE